MKKRFLAMLLTVVMVLALAVPALAVSEVAVPQGTHLHDDTFGASILTIDRGTGFGLVKVRHSHTGLIGYVNYAGTTVVEQKYNTLRDYSEGLALATKNGVATYVDPTGKEVITLGVCTANDFHQGLARIVDTADGHNNTYFIDKNGKSVFILGADTAEDFQSVGLAKVQKSENGKWGLVNTSGRIVTHAWFNVIRNFKEGLAYCEWNDASGTLRKGYLNTTGALQIAGINPNYEYSDFSNGMARVYDPATKQVGYIDTTGWLAVYCQYEEGDDFCNGVARIKRGGKWGYIDKANKYTVQPKYDELWSNLNGDILVVAGERRLDTANDGGAQVIVGDNNHLILENQVGTSLWRMYYGHVNVLTGAVVTPIIYHKADRFYDGYAKVGIWRSVSFVNTAGTRVLDLGATYEDDYAEPAKNSCWDNVEHFSEGLCMVAKNGKYGFIDKANVAGGHLALPMIFDVDAAGTYKNWEFHNGKIPARLAGFSTSSRWGVVSKACTWIINPKYSAIDEWNLTDDALLAEYGGVDSHILVAR